MLHMAFDLSSVAFGFSTVFCVLNFFLFVHVCGDRLGRLTQLSTQIK